MARKHTARAGYADLLAKLGTYFPVPTSDPVMDGYFVHAISRFLDRVDALKSSAPILGARRERFDREDPPEVFPEGMSSVEELTGQLADFCRGMTIWSHPNAQVNVVPPPTIPGITAFIAGAIYNPNLIWDEYSARFAEAEIRSVAMLSDLIGFDAARSGGLFTFGGTGALLYGCKLGLEKCTGGRAMREGIREDVKIVAAQTAHYSRINVAGWLGLGTRNLVEIPCTEEGAISLAHLEEALRAAISRGERIAAIIATLGTTDAFGIDDIAAIVALRDRLAAEYRLPCLPHVHADAVIGWVWSVFRDYDFAGNPLGFRARTMRALRRSLRRMRGLAQADSVGIDFHKTGYAPYISSAVLLRDRADLGLLGRPSEQMPYLYQFGDYHPGSYTLECSRPGSGALAALANMRLLGKQGYRVLIGHAVEMAERLRERLEKERGLTVLNAGNDGPVTLFRAYPEGVSAREELRRELGDPGWRDRLLEHNAYNRRIFDRVRERSLQGEGVLISWTDAARVTSYAGGPPVGGLKSYIMSPWTDAAAVATVVRQVLEARGG